MGDDVRDILDIEGPHSGTPLSVSKEAIIGSAKKPPKKSGSTFKRPEGMARELYALLYSDNKTDVPPLIQTDTLSGYKQNKAQLGQNRPRPWKWMPFKNPARKDSAVLYHWRRVADEGKSYPFANFNKTVDVPTYSDEEYLKHLHEEYPSTWSKDETDHLFDLCRRFDLKFTIVHDRYDSKKFNPRTIESLKERYYSVCNKLAKIRSVRGNHLVVPAVCHFDAQHETDRKAQLERLYSRTQEQVQEEETLLGELKKIEQRKREREKKQQDLQKIIAAAENSEKQLHKTPKKVLHKKKVATPFLMGSSLTSIPEGAPLPIGEPGSSSASKALDKSGGVFVRSSKLKIPSSVGQRKLKVIETLLDDFGINLTPMPTEQVCTEFNEVRNDILLLLDLKAAVDSCEYELQTLRHRFEAVTSKPAKERLPAHLKTVLDTFKSLSTHSALLVMDAVMSGPSAGGIQRRRRVATLEHGGNQYKKARRF
ncbi:DNA methyltransferase 1-associated protein 1-like [Oscarella lobularis]|uniref:DNA methyltransferase 1-associated protein 1-like n=1 Tax=Oscarella lobularis TaxID=121494 RepID=UPI003314179E